MSSEEQDSGSRKAASARPPEQQQQQPLKCPRCDSPNTKFCYYNNYSLSQPRHFCKTCRRYWTKGGALRNVPIGGGCRKNKKARSRDSGSSSSSEIGGLRMFQGISPVMDFQLGGLSPLPRLNLNPSPSSSGVYNQFSTLGDISATSAASSGALRSLNYPFPPGSETSGLSGVIQDMGSMSVHGNLASSIESLSSLNQDLHWKLQQQRLATLFGGENNQKETIIPSSSAASLVSQQVPKPQPISFQNLEISKPPDISKEGSNVATTEWFFGNPFAPVNHQTPITNNNGNGNSSTSNWSAVQAWTDLQQFSTMP